MVFNPALRIARPPFFILKGFSQEDTFVFLDVNSNALNYPEYQSKLKLDVFAEVVFSVDTLNFKKLIYNEFFGKIDSVKKSQLNKLMYHRYQIDSTKTWVIRYRDLLPDIATLPKSKKTTYFPKDDSPESIEAANFLNRNKGRWIIRGNNSSINKFRKANHLTNRQVVYPYKELHKITKMIQERYKNKPSVSFINMFAHNEGYPLKNEEVIWFEDPYSIFRNTFSDGIISYKLIIIYPNGDFYIHTGDPGQDRINELLIFEQYHLNKNLFFKKTTTLF